MQGTSKIWYAILIGSTNKHLKCMKYHNNKLKYICLINGKLYYRIDIGLNLVYHVTKEFRSYDTYVFEYIKRGCNTPAF